MSLSYTTAKKLKDAGFQWDNQESFSMNGSEPRYEMYPTLSELIETCGTKLTLQGFEETDMIKEWTAYSSADIDYETGSYGIYKNGPSPEEAVANLYLAINKPINSYTGSIIDRGDGYVEVR